MGIHFPPEGRSVARLEGVQQKQCYDPWPFEHSTQPLVIRERRHIMLEVQMTGHFSGSNQQLSLSNSVQAY